MSLDFSMPQIGNHTEIHDARHPRDHQVFVELPWALMAVGIRHITPDTIPHITQRLSVFFRDTHDMLYRAATEAAEREGAELRRGGLEGAVAWYLERFIGFFANVGTETKAEFVKRMTSRIPTLSKASIRKWPWDAPEKAFRERPDFVEEPTEVAPN